MDLSNPHHASGLRASLGSAVARALASLTAIALIAGCAAPMMAPAAPAASHESAQAYEMPASAGASSYAMPDMPTDMEFQDYGVRGFVDAGRDNLSTFSVDVDTGSYSVARAYIQDGMIPPPDAVRTEEFVNAFNYGYPLPEEGETFHIAIDAAPYPFFDDDHLILRVGLQSFQVDADERPDANLTFVIDVSGSMDMDNRLGLAKRALYLLVDALRPTDSVAIVVYGDRADTILPMTPVAEKGDILGAINRLQPQGSTNAAEGITRGYDVADDAFDAERINRVILLSDGVANVGPTGPDAILALVADQAEQGIGLVTVGLGMGNYNDTLMEQLANDGDGFYSYVDTLEEAERVFVRDLTSTLLTVARNAKIQVEFNDAVVDEYRLSGYENRKVRDDDFRDDDVDAGEVGAGHSVTALYEVDLEEGDHAAAEVIATVHLRWEEPDTGEVIEINQSITVGDITPDFNEAAPSLQLAASVATFAEILRETEYAEGVWLGDVADEVARIRPMLDESGSNSQVGELENLMLLVTSMLPPSPQSLED